MTQNNSIYANHIFDLAMNRKDEVFYNSNAEHASIVHQALVKYAQDYIDIFCGCMCTEISNNDQYCKMVEEYLNKDKSYRINIILTDYSKEFLDKPIAKLLSKYPTQVTVKQYDGQLMYKEHPAHFTVTSDRAFRLETDIDNHMAFGNFNSPKQAQALRKVFEKVFESELLSPVALA